MADKTDDKFKSTFSPNRSGGGGKDGKKPGKADPAAASHPPRKKSKKGLLIFLLIFLILIGGAGYALYRIGILDPVLVAVGMMPSPEELTIEERQSRLERQADELDARAAELDKREEDVERKEKSIRLREEDVQRRESELTSFTAVMESSSPEQLDALKKVSKICNQMEAEDAVGIVQNLANADEIALVIYYMTEEKAAQLLTLLPQATAAKVLSLIIS